MRLWSIHPRYLDSKGLVALWRETLLAKNVLLGKTKGYNNHPQLIRFKESSDPVSYINYYLSEIYNESVRREYKFDSKKVGNFGDLVSLDISNGQIDYEFKHLLEKLKVRDLARFNKFKDLKDFEVHPLFKIINGPIADWEIINSFGQ